MIRLLPFLRTDQVMAMARETGLTRRVIRGKAYLVHPLPDSMRRQAPKLSLIRNSI